MHRNGKGLVKYQELFQKVLDGEWVLQSDCQPHTHWASWKVDGQEFYVYAKEEEMGEGTDGY